jgi:hypothetical protein
MPGQFPEHSRVDELPKEHIVYLEAQAPFSGCRRATAHVAARRMIAVPPLAQVHIGLHQDRNLKQV